MSSAKISDLTPDSKNANKGTQRGLKALDTSLRQYGAGRSILVDKNGKVIAGNKTLERAADIGLENVIIVPTDGTQLVAVQRTDLDLDSDDGKARALATYDNRVGQLDLDWDIDALKEVDTDTLKDLWTVDELDKLGVMEKPQGDAEPQIDRAAELQEKWQVKTGDLWKIGEHRLLCGDSTKREDVERVMGGEKADCTVTDPPYGIGVNYGEFQDTPENVKKLIKDIMPIIFDYLPAAFTPGIPSMFDYPRPAWIGAWVHPAPVSGCPWGFVGNNPILYYGADPYLKIGKGRRPDSVVMASDRQGESNHPTPKPIRVWNWLVERLTPEGGMMVFDPFVGSGTTIVACQNLGRKCRAIEISPEYCAVTLERMATAFPGIEIERV